MTDPTKKIRVLHVIKNFNLGGAETNLLNLVQAFDAERFEHHVAYSVGGEIETQFRAHKLKLFRYASRDHKIKSVASLFIVARLAGYMRSHRIDIVHTHNFNAHVWGVMAAKVAGKKVVEHVHDFRYMEEAEYARRKGNVAQFRFIRFFKGLSDRVVVLTSGNRKYLLENRFYANERIKEIRNGIPLSPIHVDAGLVRSKLGVPPDAKVVLTCARLSVEKNIELVIDMAKQVRSQVPQVLFVIAGDGPSMALLRERAERAGVSDAVKFIGFYPQIRELLSIAEVFLLPSYLELHSIAILEALSMGVPVLTSAGTGCNSDVLHENVTAVLRDPFCNEGWAEAATTLLKDEGMRRRIGLAGKDLCVRDFEIGVVADKFETLYEEMMRG